TTALVEAAKSIGATTHVGVTASSDTFYPGQERYDTYSGRVVRQSTVSRLLKLLGAIKIRNTKGQKIYSVNPQRRPSPDAGRSIA
ncbi:hypothetical protein MJM59_33035, partial [Salmonella enterica subsp. enterica serovar Montevideo]|nr:hypothetical protein [Salmonella enterica subsp. enterica serovar Montevideo]